MRVKLRRFREGSFYTEEFSLEDAEGLTVLELLYRIREEVDPSLSFRAMCRSSVCGTCTLKINGEHRLACNTGSHDRGTVFSAGYATAFVRPCWREKPSGDPSSSQNFIRSSMIRGTAGVRRDSPISSPSTFRAVFTVATAIFPAPEVACRSGGSPLRKAGFSRRAI